MYHYVYRITNIKDNKHYYGSRSTYTEPKFDLGVKYFSSSKDKEFIQAQKDNPSIFKYKIIFLYKSREEAINKEIFLHNKFNVHVNVNFYNKSKQTSTGFDTTGVIFIDGVQYTSKEYKSSEFLQYHSKNYTNVIDVNEQVIRVHINSNEAKQYRHTQTGFVNAINEKGLYEKVSIEDYIKRNLSCNNTGKVPVTDHNGNKFLCSVDDPLWLDGTYKHVSTGLVTCKDITTGEIKKISQEEYNSNDNYVGINKGNISTDNNPNSKNIIIFDSNGTIQYECNGNFKIICTENNLPFYQLRESYSNNGLPIYSSKRSLSYAKKNQMEKYIGWFAKIK